jgi:hypothetical protein
VKQRWLIGLGPRYLERRIESFAGALCSVLRPSASKDAVGAPDDRQRQRSNKALHIDPLRSIRSQLSQWCPSAARTGHSAYCAPKSALFRALMGGVGIVAPTALSEYPFACQ